jgi:MbtH protein
MSEIPSTTMTGRYLVVVNDEEQYSVWPEGRALPAGWQPVDVSGDRETCLAHIGRVWTDLRPKTLRLAMGER